MKLPVFAKLGKISTHSFDLISALFFLCYILIKMKEFLVELINQLPHFITQSTSWYDGLTMD